MSAGEPLVLRGFAARTNIRTELTDGVFEIIKPGAFRRSINDPYTDVVLNIEHARGGSGLPLARTSANSLSLTEIAVGPETGLFIEATLDPEDPDAQLLARKLANGSLQGAASFAFRVPKDGQKWEHFDTYSVRTLTEINMAHGDVTACVHGAYPDAHVAINPPAAAVARSRRSIPNYTEMARREYRILLAQTKG
jgi:HK97 family phage prohead protease